MAQGAPAPEAALSPQAFAARMAPLHRAGPLALAVSGGGDSMALLALTAEWAAERDIRLLALTVDHRLRAGSAGDAVFVEGQARALGVASQRLDWLGAKPSTGLQAAARDARYRLMTEACRAAGIKTLAFAHTQEDQAETVLMRLARGSGVDGLSAMAPATERFGLRLIRPLLGVSRATLRAVLAMRGLNWREDPTNDDNAFERVRARKALRELAVLGLDSAALAQTAQRLGEARAALDAAAADLSRHAAEFHPIGYARLAPARLAAAPRETALRLLSAAMRWTTGAVYAPGRSELERALDWIAAAPEGGGRTLHGCQLDARDGEVTVSREPASVSADSGGAEAPWDGRFFCRIEGGEAADGLTIAPLGADGARLIKAWGGAKPDWRRAPRAARLASPALWSGDALLSAPFAGFSRDGEAPVLHAVATTAPFSLKGSGEGLC